VHARHGVEWGEEWRGKVSWFLDSQCLLNGLSGFSVSEHLSPECGLQAWLDVSVCMPVKASRKQGSVVLLNPLEDQKEVRWAGPWRVVQGVLRGPEQASPGRGKSFFAC
jgi:hypothetical protein